MSLNALRFIQRVVGFLLIVYGIYLIFVTQEFFGTLLIILAFLIFPSVNREKKKAFSNDFDYSDHDNDSAFDSDTRYERSADGGGNSDGGGGDS